MKKGPGIKQKGIFGGAELGGPFKHPYHQEEMQSIHKELLVNHEEQEALSGGQRLLGVYGLTLLVEEWLSWEGSDQNSVFHGVLYSIV